MQHIRKPSWLSVLLILFFQGPGFGQNIVNEADVAKHKSEAHRLKSELNYDSANFHLRVLNNYYQDKEQWDSCLWYRNEQIDNLMRVRNLEDAKVVIFKTIEIGQDHQTPGSLVLHDTYFLQCLYILHTGDYAGAISEYQNTIENYKNAGGNFESLKMAEVYNNLATAHYFYGQVDEAQQYYQLTYEIKSKLFHPEHVEVAKCYSNFGIIEWVGGNYEGALVQFQKTLNIFLKHPKSKEDEIGNAYGNVAAVYQAMGDLKSAMLNFLRSLKYYQLAYTEKHPGVGAVYLSIATINHELGDYHRSIELGHMAARIFSETLGPLHPHVGKALIGVADNYVELGDLAKAKTTLQKAFEITQKQVGENSPDLISIYNRFGIIEHRSKNLDSAMVSFKKCLAIAEQTYAPGHQSLANYYGNIGLVYTDKQEYNKAVDNISKALKILKFAPGQNPSTTAHMYLALADASIHQNLDQAVALYDSSLQVLFDLPWTETQLDLPHADSVEIVDPSISIDLLKKRAQAKHTAYRQNNRLEDLKTSLSTYTFGLKYLKRILISYSDEDSQINLDKSGDQLVDSGLKVALELYQITGLQSYLHLAFDIIENSKADVLHANMMESNAWKYSVVSDSIKQVELRLSKDITEFKAQIKILENQDSVSLTQLNELREKLFKAKWSHESLTDSVKTVFLDQFETTDASMPTIHEIQDALDEQVVLIQYHMGTEHVVLSVLTNDTLAMIDLPYQQLVADINQLYKAINKRSKKVYHNTALKLYSGLILPLEDLLKGKSELVIIPHKNLWYLPFEVLLSQDDDEVDFTTAEYLIKKYSISYHYSASLFFKGQMKYASQVNEESNLLAFAPVFDDNAGYIASTKITDDSVRSSSQVSHDQLAPLPMSMSEVNEIIRLYGQAEMNAKGYVGSQANELKFKRLASKYRHIHLASHSFIDKNSPSASGIFFSKPSISDHELEQDGVLYCGEVYNLKLEAELLVMSSCESGLGKLAGGEGLLSITRGFYSAGIQNIVYSLWKVYDKQTKDLMVDFYGNFLTKKNYAEALQDAKLKMIANPSTAFPKNWAGFVLLGK